MFEHLQWMKVMNHSFNKTKCYVGKWWKVQRCTTEMTHLMILFVKDVCIRRTYIQICLKFSISRITYFSLLCHSFYNFVDSSTPKFLLRPSSAVCLIKLELRLGFIIEEIKGEKYWRRIVDDDLKCHPHVSYVLILLLHKTPSTCYS